ncbi:MAG: c-type cytochrome biogenesis protein CcsB [Candidatus Eremiobacteraeota bacterium]|nr:c-type cytochrome biogenesis protein CcsB [Candidatus Eremiobacteraeota bacterium]
MISHMPLDQVLMAIALSTYIVGAIVLIAYFFSRAEWQRNLGAPLVIAGCAAQFAQLVARYELTHIWPLLNLYGSLSLFSAMSVLIFIVFAFRYHLWFAGGFVVAIAALFLTYGLTWNEGTLPAVPSLQSYWAKIHVPIVVSSYAAFMVAAVVSALYLLKYYFDRSLITRTAAATLAPAGSGAAGMSAMQFDGGILNVRRDTPAIEVAAQEGNVAARWLKTLPTLAQLDVLIYRVVAIGLPLLTIGIITGAWWAKEAWGAYWQWDPKETAALALWIFYAIYMHLHTRHAWRGLRSAWLGVFGLPLMLFVYLGVNIVIGNGSMHSYKL